MHILDVLFVFMIYYLETLLTNLPGYIFLLKMYERKTYTLEVN